MLAPRCGVATTDGEREQRAVGARLGAEHVDPGAGDAALVERRVQRVLVDDAAAGRVDEVHRRLDDASWSSPISPTVSGVLGRWTEITSLGEQLVERHEAHAELGGAAGGTYGS